MSDPVYADVVRSSTAQAAATTGAVKTSARLENSAASAVALLQTLAVEAEKGQGKLEQQLALHVLPLVGDVHQMVTLCEGSIQRYEAAAARNRALRTATTPPAAVLPADGAAGTTAISTVVATTADGR